MRCEPLVALLAWAACGLGSARSDEAAGRAGAGLPTLGGRIWAQPALRVCASARGGYGVCAATAVEPGVLLLRIPPEATVSAGVGGRAASRWAEHIAAVAERRHRCERAGRPCPFDWSHLLLAGALLLELRDGPDSPWAEYLCGVPQPGDLDRFLASSGRLLPALESVRRILGGIARAWLTSLELTARTLAEAAASFDFGAPGNGSRAEKSARAGLPEAEWAVRTVLSRTFVAECGGAPRSVAVPVLDLLNHASGPERNVDGGADPASCEWIMSSSRRIAAGEELVYDYTGGSGYGCEEWALRHSFLPPEALADADAAGSAAARACGQAAAQRRQAWRRWMRLSAAAAGEGSPLVSALLECARRRAGAWNQTAAACRRGGL